MPIHPCQSTKQIAPNADNTQKHFQTQKGTKHHMKVNGIIAEYNPFHNGHKYHLEESLRRTGADYTIIAMSGNFVQRGAPAVIDKHIRAEMALRCGADLVLELPVLYATASAEYFASGAVSLLDKLGVVTHLCFGSEYKEDNCQDKMLLSEIASILSEETRPYGTALKKFLRLGHSYPAARTMALGQCNPTLNDYQNILCSPNNILGIEYCKAILGRNSHMIPTAITRSGADYHDPHPSAQFSSALSIRRSLYAGYTSEQLHVHMPSEAVKLLTTYLETHALMRSDCFSTILYYKLLMGQETGYTKYLDVSRDLSNRIQNRLKSFTGFGAFCDLLKSKDMTYTRISRCLLHILLEIETNHMASGKKADYVPYARVLGFRKSARPLLSAIKKHSAIPLITKLADAQKTITGNGKMLLRQDILSSQLYRGIAAAPFGCTAVNECSLPLIIL